VVPAVLARDHDLAASRRAEVEQRGDVPAMLTGGQRQHRETQQASVVGGDGGEQLRHRSSLPEAGGGRRRSSTADTRGAERVAVG
jgi:hypothetical protein